MRKALLISSFILSIFFTSCYECKQCHKIEVTKGADVGSQEVTGKQEVCSRKDERALEKAVSESSTKKTFWVCGVLELDEEEE